MREIRLVYLRNGARNWHLYEDCRHSNRFQMEVVASSWNEYQRQNERLTKNEKELLDKLASLRVDPDAIARKHPYFRQQGNHQEEIGVLRP